MNLYYKSEAEIEAVVRGFESCLIGKDQFPHKSHLTVAVWYLRNSTFEAAIESMRAGLLNFMNHHAVGRQKYNETLTIFWMRMVNGSMESGGMDLSLVETTNAVIEALVDSRLAFDYYSPELLNSDEAKSKWVEPDLKCLPKVDRRKLSGTSKFR